MHTTLSCNDIDIKQDRMSFEISRRSGWWTSMRLSTSDCWAPPTSPSCRGPQVWTEHASAGALLPERTEPSGQFSTSAAIFRSLAFPNAETGDGRGKALRLDEEACRSAREVAARNRILERCTTVAPGKQ